SLLQVSLLALRALHAGVDGLLQPADVLAFGIAAAAEKTSVLAPAEHHRPAALFARLVDLFFLGDLDLAVLAACKVFGVLALGVLRAGEELAVAAPFDHHHRAALLACDVGRHLLPLDVAHLLVGLFKVAREGSVETLHRLLPVLLPLLDLVENVLHAGGELDVENIREGVDEKIGYEKAELGRRERAALVERYVLAVQGIRDDARIRRRPADAVFFQLFNQGRLREARRRLREMLARLEAEEPERVAGPEIRERRLLFVVLVVASFGINANEAIELELLSSGAK